MSESSSVEVNGGQLQNFTIDQFAGAFALSLGAVGTLLLVIWQSRCLCRCRLGFSDTCYIFDCSREPPPIETSGTAPVEDSQEPSPDREAVDEVEVLIPDSEQPAPPPAGGVEEIVVEERPVTDRVQNS